MSYNKEYEPKEVDARGRKLEGDERYNSVATIINEGIDAIKQAPEVSSALLKRILKDLTKLEIA